MKDYRVKIAIWSIVAYRELVNKVIIGMSFIGALIYGMLLVLHSYNSYKFDYNKRHAQDCYFYSLISENYVSNDSIINIEEYAQIGQKSLMADETQILIQIENNNISALHVTAGNTGLIINDVEYRIDDYYTQNKYGWNDLVTKGSPIHMLMYLNDYSNIPYRISDAYSEDFLLGDWPQNEGEILFDDYLLRMFGVQDDEMQDIIGKKVSFYCQVDGKEEYIFCNYVLSGISYNEFIPHRESASTMDNHLEHLMINLKKGDYDNFNIKNGSIRLYFDNFQDYQKQLIFDNGSVEVNIHTKLPIKFMITGDGLKYAYLYAFMHYIGIVILIIIVLVIIVVMLSLYYTMYNYNNLMMPLIRVLAIVGVSRKNINFIEGIKNIIILVVSSVVGLGYVGILKYVFNSICSSFAGFVLKINLITFLIAVLSTGSIYLFLAIKTKNSRLDL